MIIFLQNIVRFILLILIQVFVLNNIRFSGFINPYIYILFILLLPVRFPRWISLILGFALGLIIDSFTNTPGVHAFATVLIAYLRNPVINAFISVEEGANPVPGLHSFGVSAFVKYLISLVVIHHTAFYFLEVFSFHDAGITLMRIVLNSFVTITILLGIQSFKKGKL
ncbi:MAG: rod shape-determining protein MreD [Bacteroidales bacterium]|nr:rod shape-determining protein MreD [Bacteroidales bacterium]OJX91359.1 MAG: rod shape-determining protein MreD [Paludibacter sp. 47-17]